MPKPTHGRASPHPHDALFRWTFSQRQHAAGLLRAALRPHLVAAIDFRTLRVEKASFVSAALRSRYSDLVLSVEIRGSRMFFYALFEHQRGVEPLMIVRMGIYMMRLWEHVITDEPRRTDVPPIMPLLLHQSDTGWTAATAFQDVVAVDPALWPELRPYTPCFEMKLIDVSEGQASHLVEEALTAMGKVALWCMSVAGDDARMEREIERIGAALLEVIRAPNGLAALEVVLRYLVATHRRLDVTKVGKLLEKAAGPQAEEAIVTWIDEIERRGERRGKREGQAEMLLRLMAARFGPVPDEVAGRVEAGSEAELGRWALRVLTAQSPADVIAGAEKHTGRRTPSARKPAARKGTGEAATTSKRRA